ncbi:3-oxoacyl-ACP reductase [Klebsiella michiganensis]|uniref:3-oxoacyl-ACP reductase n=1 Tax=Klebsiella michiganensis TaxID=1134687 RepID=A0A7H4LVS3_9ENTR|nr:3-oxoacyl-ACP reductase [Klebsiella michiganensis]
MDFQIQQRVALVCGAGSGLGQAIALSLAQEGVKVAGHRPQRGKTGANGGTYHLIGRYCPRLAVGSRRPGAV